MSTTARIPDPELDGFLAVLAAQRAPRTVDAYRRDLEHFARFLGSAPSRATTEELERYLAQQRADGLSGATIARRIAALRSLYRHLMLLGARADNPAAELSPPSTGAAPAAHALAVRGRATDRRGERDHAALAARLGDRRAPLRRRPSRQRARLARARQRRPRPAHRARARKGIEGADRADRPARRRVASPLPLARPPLPRATPASRAVPEREGRAADPIRRLPDPPQAGGEGRPRAGARPPAPPAGTPSPRTCSKAGPTSAASRRCSATPTSPRRSCTRTCPTSGAGSSTSRRTRTRGGVWERGRTVNKRESD